MAVTGNEFFRKTMAEVPSDNRALTREQWEPTPFMADVFVAGREAEMQEWLFHRLGQESSPMHARPGKWRWSGATIHGWRWIGFATEKLLAEYQAKWPSPEWVGKSES